MSPGSILFIQLPLLDHTYSYIQGNFPCAGAAIVAYIYKHIRRDITMEILPYMLANFASDAVILRYIKDKKPDIVAFTTYLWNLERNLRLAAAIKREANQPVILMGGPEISQGSAAFQDAHSYVDFFVSGEGEWFFSRYLSGSGSDPPAETVNGNILVVQNEDELVPVEKIAEPFAAGFVEPMPDSSIFLEMTRGCPYRCSYCYYSKNCLSVREMPLENLLSVLKKHDSLSEIYLLSPTFDRAADFLQKIEKIRSVNNGISLHTEMRSDRIDAKSAKILKQAGFNSAEVGLQTLSRDILANVRRGSEPESEIRGMTFMRDAGIDLKIGLIPGLPGESMESFQKGVKRLTELGFAQNIELYPLMILPGTAIREEAERRGIFYQKKAPYYYLEGWGINSDDIRKLAVDLEIDSGFGQQVNSLPDFSLSETGALIKSIYFDGRNSASWSAEKYLACIESACFDFHITLAEKAPLALFGSFVEGLPGDILYTFVFYSERLIDERQLISVTENYMNGIISRLNIFNSFKAASPFRFFQVFKKSGNYKAAYDGYGLVDPILLVEDGNAEASIRYIADNGPDNNFMLAGTSLSPAASERLFELYRDCPEMAAFTDASLQRQFYALNGGAYIETGFSFRKMKF